MTKNERLINLIGKDLFGVANMVTHYDIDVPEEVEKFMMYLFEANPKEPIEYTFDELKELAVIILGIVNENQQVTKEPMIKFSLKNLKEFVNKTEQEMLSEKDSQIELWDDMDDISSVGGLSGLIKKHGGNRDFLEAQEILKCFLD